VHYACTQKRGSKLSQGDPVTLVCRPASAGLARVSTCRIALPTTLLQPTNLCDTARLRCVLNVNACSFSCSAILFLVFSGDLHPCPLPILIHAKMWIGHTKGHACCLSPASSHSILARLDLPPLFLGPGPQASGWEYPLLYSPNFLTLSLAPQQMPNSKNRTQRRLAGLSKDHSGSYSAIHAQNPTPRIFVTPKKVGHLTSGGHRSPVTSPPLSIMQKEPEDLSNDPLLSTPTLLPNRHIPSNSPTPCLGC
jgi:hypothetical protein